MIKSIVRKGWKPALLTVICLGIGFGGGIGFSRWHQSKIAAKVVDLRASGSFSSHLGSSVTGPTKGQPGLTPSGGHLNLTGTVTERNQDSISLKLDNNQVIKLSVSRDIAVLSRDSAGKHLGIEDIKVGNKVSAMITVAPDGSFIVRTIEASL